MKRRGKIRDLRAKGCADAIKWYQQHHEIETMNGYAPCQYDGHPLAFNEMTYAHQVGRPHIAVGVGESLENGWIMCLKHHQWIDTHPAFKREMMELGVNVRTGGNLGQ